jgi:hypothetical protein
MRMNLGKFFHTETGKYVMSILLGFGLATLFRSVCKGRNCMAFYAAPLESFHDKIYKVNGKCVKYNHVATKCNKDAKTIYFE